MAKNHIGFQPDQVLRRGPRPFDITCGPTIVDPNVASVRPTQLLKPPQERCDARLSGLCSFGIGTRPSLLY
jgi:hypothetical protein